MRYAFDVPKTLTAAQLPLTVTARLRHRSRTLRMQATCVPPRRPRPGRRSSRAPRARATSTLDPCKPQPITLIAQTQIEVGQGATLSAARPAWERMYEHGMALTATVTERLDEAHAVLDAALAAVPAANPKARAMVLVQLGWVASKQGRVDDALALVAEARALLPTPGPAVLDAIATDALARVWKWQEAVAPAKACTERAPQNTTAWMMYARVLGSVGDNAGALAAATKGLELAPRDPDLLRSAGHGARRARSPGSCRGARRLRSVPVARQLGRAADPVRRGLEAVRSRSRAGLHDRAHRGALNRDTVT